MSIDPLEKVVEARFNAHCKRKGWTTVKLGNHFIAGWPDRLVLMGDGHIGFVEIKRSSGKLSALQRSVLTSLIDRGYFVDVIYGIEEIVDGISRLEAYCQTGTKLPRIPEKRN